MRAEVSESTLISLKAIRKSKDKQDQLLLLKTKQTDCISQVSQKVA